MNSDIFNLSVDIKFCHISYHDKDWVERKTKVDYTIWNIYSGSLVLEINDKTFIANAGDVILFHPGDTYKAYSNGDHCYFLVTFFSVDIGNSIDLLMAYPTSGIYSNDFVKKISDTFCKNYQTKYIELQNADLGLYAAFLTFFAELSTQFGKQIPFRESSDMMLEMRISTLLKYIDRNTGSELTVKGLASYMGMSEKYFSNYFHMHMGMTPKQYLIKCKMKYALDLLSIPELTLQDISQRLKYADQYSFAKAFKSYYGEAPGTFRKHYIV